LNVDHLPSFSIIIDDYYKQGGLQIAGTFISMGIGIVFGILAAIIIRIFYAFSPE
jgi:hypothetical protein